MERGGGELEKTNLVFTIRLREGKLREGFYNPILCGATENGDTGQEVIYGKRITKKK